MGIIDQTVKKIPRIPICFTGMGIFRVWTETVYANGSLYFPSQDFAAYDVFNIIAAITLLSFAATSRWIAPLYGKKYVTTITGILLIVSACLTFSSVIAPQIASLVAFPAALFGGIGISLIILLWSELYGCLNPLRVGLYYSSGIILSTLILWLFKGLDFYWLWVLVCLIPIIALVFLRKSYDLLPSEERPHAAWGTFSLPWKPIAVVAFFSFSYGLCEPIFTSYLGIHSGLGALVGALVILVGISLFRERFTFSLVLKIALPFMIISLIPFSMLVPLGDEVSSVFALGSYTLCLILIMVILSNLTYRYGVNAIWLFGIERAVRLFSVQLGIGAKNLTLSSTTPLVAELVFAAVVVILIVSASAFFFSEKQLSSPWGAVLRDTFSSEQTSYLAKNRLGTKCHELSMCFGLTQREEEILLLLAQKKSSGDIEKELFVAKSTVKTHIKHIYQKIAVHSRKELFALLGVE